MNLVNYVLVNALVSLLTARQWPAKPRCFEIANPLNPGKVTQVPCDWDRPTLKRRAPINSNSTINIQLDCKDKLGRCPKVKKAFEKASEVLSSFIEFNQPIVIDAKFYSLCREEQICTLSSEGMVLGAAAPAKMISIVDNDNIERLYPQSLAKQFNLKGASDVNFESIDITASFNSEASWWFEGEGKIRRSQSDFFSIIAHELMHGLGFASSLNTWMDPESDVVTPYPSTEGDKLAAFLPYALDRLIVTTDNMNSIQPYLDPFMKYKLDQTLRSADELQRVLQKSPLRPHYKKLNELSTTPKALSILLPKGNSLLLETSYQPFRLGSSVSHLSRNKYVGTQESLMMAEVETGYNFMATAKDKVWLTAPYGPQLIAVLGELGYPVKNYTRTSESPRADNQKPNRRQGSNSSNANHIQLNISLISMLLFTYLLI